MSHPQLTRHRISLLDYHRMIETGIITEQDKVELIAGEIVHMSPKGSRHSACIQKILTWLPGIITGQVELRIQDPIQIPDMSSEPEPDLALVRARSDFYINSHPAPQDVVLLVEVADSSLQIDREVKMPLYATANIPAYWIINLPDQLIELHHSPMGDRFREVRIFEPDQQIRIPGLEIDSFVADWLV